MLAQRTGSLDPRGKLCIRVDEANAHAGERNDPIQILNAGFKGTGPDIFLIVRKVAQELYRIVAGVMRIVVTRC